MNGQSQAVRIPKNYRLKGSVCEISKKGDMLIIKEKATVGWRTFLENFSGFPDFEVERNHSSTRNIDL